MADNLITRDEAIDILFEIVEKDILCEEYDTSLREIMSCLIAENEGRHEWGADPDEIMELVVARCNWTDEQIDNAKRIDQKYRFIPSEFEAPDLIERQLDRYDDWDINSEFTQEERIKFAMSDLSLDKKIKNATKVIKGRNTRPSI